MKQLLEKIPVSKESQTDLLDLIVKRSRTGALQDVTLSFTKIMLQENEAIVSTSSVTMLTSFISDYEYRQLIAACQKPHMKNYNAIQFSKALIDKEVQAFCQSTKGIENHLLYEIRHDDSSKDSSIPEAALFRTVDDKFYTIRWH